MVEFPKDQIEELRAFSPDIAQAEEGGLPYLLIPHLWLPPGCDPEMVDSLLCPVPRDGYPSRLFFASRIKTKATFNWNANGVRILDRVWEAFSWKVDVQNLRLAQMVTMHLRPLQ